jgi:hypothetical protein
MMTTPRKKAGIWMDHSNAHVLDFTSGTIEETIITSGQSDGEKSHGNAGNENLIHHKENDQLAAYYNHLKASIRNYDEVVLFGPTTAKNELVNLIKHDHLFEKIKVTALHADKMTANQQHAFVKDHFSNN